MEDELSKQRQRVCRLAQGGPWSQARVDKLLPALEALRGTSGPYSSSLGQEVNRALAGLLCGEVALARQALPYLGNLEYGSLDLSHMELEALPPVLLQTPGLRSLHLDHNRLTTLPEDLGTLTEVEHLQLRNNQLTRLPEALGRCHKLETLYLSHNQLSALPQSLGRLERLRALYCDKNQLTALPEEMGDLQSLRYLHLRSNRLTGLPWSMHRLQRLEELHLASNPIKSFPEVLFYLKLRDASGLKGPGGRKRTLAQRISFCRRLSSTQLDLEARRRVFALSEGQPAPRSAWFEALHVSRFEDEARQAILGWGGQASFEENPLRAGSVVALLGSTALKKSDLKARLKERGLGYAAKLSPEVTHVVVGKKPPLELLPLLEEHSFTFVSDQALNKALETEADRFLLDQAVPTEARANLDNLRTLLGSLEEASAAMGLEMLKAGGVPRELYGDLFGLARFAPWSGLKRKARDLLKLHGDPAMQAALKDRAGLIHGALPAHQKTTENFSAWQRRHPWLDMGQVALMALRHRQHGLPWLLTRYPVNHPLRRQAFALMRQGDTLDLGAFYAHDYAPFLHLAHHYPRIQRSPRAFPPELLDHSDLKILSLRGCIFAEIPEELGLFARLERLDLSLGILQALPDSLAQLRTLRALDLSGNHFSQVPPVIARMTGLTHLLLHQNHCGGGHQPLHLDAQARQQLPALRYLTQGQEQPHTSLLSPELP